jgi:Lhr-like helicase
VPEPVVQHCLHSAGIAPEERRVFEPHAKPWSARRSGQMPAQVRHVMIPPPRPALLPLLRRLTASEDTPAEGAEAAQVEAAGAEEEAQEEAQEEAGGAAEARRVGGAVVFVESKYASDALLDALRRERPPDAPKAAEAPQGRAAGEGGEGGEGGEFRRLTPDEQRHIMRWRLRADGVHSESNRHDAIEMGGRQRGLALRHMAEGKLNVLTATDMLSRGVDIKGASYVVNACMPEDSGVYLHRAGRVGRLGGGPGVVVSLPETAKEVERLRGYAKELGIELHETRL